MSHAGGGVRHGCGEPDQRRGKQQRTRPKRCERTVAVDDPLESRCHQGKARNVAAGRDAALGERAAAGLDENQNW